MGEYHIEYQNGMTFESDEGVCDNISLDFEWQVRDILDNEEKETNN
jgi:hypothetical protein